ncbi:MAG: hypothetical protein JWO66_2712, partial [Candidatus Eremiobacteraeota bacterium]|nr:hypothetical protein [Candidatus Eremiobacteraeota bacterium]
IARPRALVLSGGVALGCYEAGVVKGLQERGFAFDVICGTSIGAVNGAMLAQGDAVHLEELWHTVSRLVPPVLKLSPAMQALADRAAFVRDRSRGVVTRFLKLIALLEAAEREGEALPFEGVFDPASVRRVLEGVRLDKVTVPFLFPATNIDRAQSEAFYAPGLHPDPSVVIGGSAIPVHLLRAGDPAHVAMYPEAVRASAAFPVAYAPVGLVSVWSPGETERYLDGGVAHNTPVRLARRAGARSAVCVFVQPRDSRRPKPKNIVDVARNLYTVNQQQLLNDEMLLTFESGVMAARAGITKDVPLPDGLTLHPPIDLFEIRPAERLALDKADKEFGFDDQALLDADFARGYEDGRRGPVPYAPVAPFPNVL